ncbi:MULTISPECIES: DUF1108 family protein [Staphylococcus]|uniref:DUF1108 family protein n=1 Tax=Staphylococcus TaxID=1279 RepID=UPI0005053903|nr:MULTISPECIES: DUF1108 family protein [Staphylococcus]MBE2133593.1 DUF1108 family protein [Staphylococcus argenteus]MBE2137383.1 DUF1108 family protein [Staphylococcus argenteus]MBE2146347.1 DUF1108 family protein [Staphylococcus argenteus]MBE2161657.1 DUF1108 family protein [Staphylococcus argenteus]MCG9800257.1 DUF1108 family protein [Staphylococcus argenteus]
MYYKTGDVCQKIINVDGFDFQLRVKRHNFSVEVVVLDHEDNSIDWILVTDENDLYTALDILKQTIYEWIEFNTDEQDKLINLIMKW